MAGFLEPEDDDDPTNRWLKADLAEHGEIRIRLSKSLGLHTHDVSFENHIRMCLKLCTPIWGLRFI